MFRKAIAVGLLGFISLSALAATQLVTKEMMSTDLRFVESVFDAQYAPKEWKHRFTGWTLKGEMEKAQNVVLNDDAMSVHRYQGVLNQFFKSTKDYHVGVRFHSTESARLALEIRSAEGKYLLVYIDRSQLPESVFPFGVGDEVVAFDGRPIADVAAEIERSLGGNTAETDRLLAEMRLTRRSRAAAMEVPKGPVTLTVRPQNSEQTFTRQLIWDYTPEEVRGGDDVISSVPKSHKPSILTFNPEMVPALKAEFDSWAAADENPYLVGGRVSFIPALGTKLWESEKENPFHAYMFRTKSNKIIGYVRIPSYGAGETEAAAFVKILQRFAETTDALLIDQINNPGGSVFYLYSLVAMLTDQAFDTPKHRMALTQEDVAGAVATLKLLASITNEEQAQEKLGKTIGGYPTSYQLARFFQDYSQFVIDQWNQGKKLTDPYFLGIDRINPHPEVNYTKPILLLTNALDFSGGDFFPAILQDNKRVKILGTRTAGAGGYVRQVSYPNALGVSNFSLTASIAERVDRDPIENLGVKPDIEYEMTAEDLRSGYKGYTSRILEALEEMTR